MINEQHEKYCKHSKYANKLCGRVCERESCSHGANVQYFKGWERCPIDSQQIEVIEKDLKDRIIETNMEKESYQGDYGNRLKRVIRGAMADYAQAIESEKKECEHCQHWRVVSNHPYCRDCGRKLR